MKRVNLIIFALFLTCIKINATSLSLGSSEIIISEIFQTPEKGFYQEPKIFEIHYDDTKLPKTIDENTTNISVYYINDNKLIRISNTTLDTRKNIATFETYFFGSFCVLARITPFGIIEEGKYKEGNNPVLLIHGPLLSYQTWKNLKEEIRRTLPERLILTFDYPVNQDIEKSAKLLSNELKRLHKKYGRFELDVITHSYGNLVAIAYVAKDNLFHNDMEKGLGIVPPLNGSHLVIRENIQDLVKFSDNNNLKVSDVAKSLTFFTTLGEYSQILEPDNERFKRLFELFHKNVSAPQQGGKSKKPTESEVIRGNKSFFNIENKSDFKITELFELQEGIGDGLMDSNINRGGNKISLLSMEPYPYNHLEIIEMNDVVKKIIKFIKLPKIYSTRFLEKISLYDLYKESEYEINIHKWRNFSTDFIYQMNKNMLASTEQNAILFTNGDMDTYYPLDMQNKEGFRKDVAIVNLSLLNTSWFIKIVRDEMVVELNIPDKDIELCQTSKKSVLYPKKLKEAAEFKIKSVNSEDTLTINFKEGKILYVNNQVVIQIIKDNYGKRPIYFAVTVPNVYGFDNQLQNEGLVDRVVSIKSKNQIDIEKLITNIDSIYSYKDIFNDSIYKDKNTKRMFNNYGAEFFRASQYYHSKKDYRKAVEYMEEGIKFIQDKNRFYNGLSNLYIEAINSEIENNHIEKGFLYLENAIKNNNKNEKLPEIIYQISIKANVPKKGIELLNEIREYQNSTIIENYINSLQKE